MSRRKSKKKKQDAFLKKAETLSVNTEQEPEAPAAEQEKAEPAEPPADESKAEEPEVNAEPAAEQKSDTNTTEPKKAAVRVVVPTKIRPASDENGNPVKTDQYGNPVPEHQSGTQKRRREPVRTTTPADIQKPQVSFMNSIAHVEAESLPKQTASAGSTAQAYDHAVFRHGNEDDTAYSPKIRRMSDSTRAKELRRRRSTGEKLPYGKDTPVPDR